MVSFASNRVVDEPRAAARELVNRGYPVLPVKPDKAPYIARGAHGASTDAQQADMWWERWPDAMVGVACGGERGLLVIDCDRNHGDGSVDGVAAFAALAREHGGLPETVRHLTPSGGEHIFLRLPVGVGHGNARGTLPRGVDVRGQGGYIIVPPSKLPDGRSYRAEPGQNLLDREPAEAPAWLVEVLTQKKESASRLANSVDPCASGTLRLVAKLLKIAPGVGEQDGSSRLIRLARVAVDAGATGEQFVDAVRAYERIAPFPIDYSDEEIARRFSDAAAQQPASTDERWRGIRPLDLASADVTENIAVVDGFLREREIVNIIAPVKIGKSVLMVDVATSIATGRPCLGLDRFATTRRPVILLDNELHSGTLNGRIQRVATARGLSVADLGDMRVFAMRGRNFTLDNLGEFLAGQGSVEGGVLIIDALYRALPDRIEENNNGHMRTVFNGLDAVAQQFGVSIVVIHHTSKGDQSLRSIGDVGAGAGAISRAADAHLILRNHEEDGVVVLEGIVRSFPTFEPLCLRFDYPLFNVVDGLDPTELRTSGRSQRQPSRRVRPAQPDLSDFVFRFVPSEPTRRDVILAHAAAAEMSGRAAGQMLTRAVDSGFVQRSIESGSRAYLFRRTIL